jgi:uncharacterized protein (TIGR02678 family)
MAADNEVPALERAMYQRAARAVLTHSLITENFPDTQTLSLVRRWAVPLRADMARLFDYRLELTPTTARLFRVRDALDASQPAMAGTNEDRPFDRRRYACLALAIAVLGRAGLQISLSELADRVAAEAARIDDLDLTAEDKKGRDAFVDAISWLQTRGAVRLADGSARRWADDPTAGEALYDIDRDILRAVYRPTRVLQHVSGVGELLHRSDAESRATRRQAAGQRVRRALVEQPVVYDADLDPADRGTLRTPSVAADVADLTGMIVERRAEGIALLDVSGRFSDRRFPGTGTIAQAALLLLNQMADRILDVDAPPLLTLPAPPPVSGQLINSLDAVLPRTELVEQPEQGARGPTRNAELDRVPHGPEPSEDSTSEDEPSDRAGTTAPPTYPMLEDSWLTATMADLLSAYGPTFRATLTADPARMLAAIIGFLTELRMVIRVPGGVLALPLLARYRNAVVTRGTRKPEGGLFDL